LRWSDVDLERGTIYCRRAKGSRSSVHPLKRDEATALERVLRASSARAGDYVFPSERGERMSRSAFWRLVAQAGERAGLAVHAYAHLLRHSCGYYRANKGLGTKRGAGGERPDRAVESTQYEVLVGARLPRHLPPIG
jgi:integrase